MKKIVKNSTLFALIFSLAAMTGCVMKSDFEAMQMERQQDVNRIQQLEAELEETKQILKKDIENSQTPVRKKTADIWAEMQGMRKEIATLRGELDAMTLRMDRQVGTTESQLTMMTLKEEIDELEFIMENELQVDMDKARESRGTATAVPNEVSGTVVPAPVDSVTVGDGKGATGAAVVAPVPASDTDPAKALYDKAYALYKEGKFEQARSYWAEFTDTFKGHPFSPSATFWQGQCYYKLKDYARAAILFEDVIDKFKKSSKYKSALLKAGYSWNYLGKPELAKMRMEEIVKKFPKSVEATQAKRFLKKVK